MSNGNSQDRFRAVLVLLAAIATIVFNTLAAMGYVNGVTPAQVSAKYETVLTPAGYAFSIWTLIYVGLVGFSIYQLMPSQILRFRRVRTLVIASCVLNCGWVFFWHQERLGACLVLIVGLALVLGLIVWQLGPAASLGEWLGTRAVFGLYFGWVTCAAFVNLLIWLQYSGLISVAAATPLAVVFMLMAAGLAVLVRWRLSDFMFPLAAAWALTAISVKQSGNTAIVVAGAIGTMTALITAGSVVTRLKDSSSE
jgi:benzodiazapine receptor